MAAGEAKTIEQWLRKSEEYLADAQKANSAGMRTIAYDQFGYCIEAKAKAVLMTKRGFSEWTREKVPAECFTHSIPTLIKQANLTQELARDRKANARLRGFWLVVKDWQPIRYNVDQPSTRVMVDLERAITDKPDGILQWLNKHL